MKKLMIALCCFLLQGCPTPGGTTTSSELTGTDLKVYMVIILAVMAVALYVWKPKPPKD